jgi:hypothetical protein
MAKQNTIGILLVIALIVVGMLLQSRYDLFAITGNEVITRNLPSQVSAGETFTLTYVASGTSGRWGASLEDSISGGCMFPGGVSSIKDLWLSTEGNTRAVSITAPQSGSCTFTGDYQFGDASLKPFPSQTVTICQPATCASLGFSCGTAPDGCGGTLNCGSCGTGYACQNNVCFQCNTPADTNCDGVITDTELISYGVQWLNNQISRSELGSAITAWALQ